MKNYWVLLVTWADHDHFHLQGIFPHLSDAMVYVNHIGSQEANPYLPVTEYTLVEVGGLDLNGLLLAKSTKLSFQLNKTNHDGKPEEVSL